MVNRILVPLDGSILASWVIPWADELAGALDAEVELVNVVTAPLAGGRVGPGLSHLDGEREASAILAGAAGRFQHASRVERATLVGSPGRRIAEHARAIRAHMIVMASHGRYGLQRALLGSVASTIIRESATPVWIIRGDLAAGPATLPRRVLVTLQGVVQTPYALSAVLPLAQRLGWTLTLFAAIPFQTALQPPLGSMVPLDVSTEDQFLDVDAYLHRVTRLLQARGVSADVLVCEGDAVQGIVDAAHTSGVDLITMSAADARDADWLTTNSAIDAVLAKADHPVLVLPSPTVPLQAALPGC